MTFFSRFPVTLSLIMSLPLGACASAPTHPEGAPPSAEAPHHPEGAPPTGPAQVVFELPGAPGEGLPREPKVRLQTPALKVATIVLRQGTVLPEHDAPVPVTIVALSGAGVVTVGSERLPLDLTHAVYLAPKVPHAVIPEPGTDLVVLVHHLGAGEEHHP